jgi:hypothetical protein
MLLRRVIQHVTDQNWFAVGIDLVIVVLGVFIGLEVANWNEARRDREVEAIYLDRLDREIAEILPEAAAGREMVRSRFERIVEVKDFFATGNGLDALGGEHCAAIGRSHIFAGTIFYPPTIKELIATGRIVLIRDDTIRTAILSFDQTHAEASQLRTDIQIDRRLLARTYPDLIDSGLSSWEDARCDFPAMARHRAFLNDFADNMRRFDAYASQVAGRQSEILTALGLAVASGLPPRAADASARATPAASTDEHGDVAD